MDFLGFSICWVTHELPEGTKKTCQQKFRCQLPVINSPGKDLPKKRAKLLTQTYFFGSCGHAVGFIDGRVPGYRYRRVWPMIQGYASGNVPTKYMAITLDIVRRSSMVERILVFFCIPIDYGSVADYMTHLYIVQPKKMMGKRQHPIRIVTRWCPPSDVNVGL